MTTSDLNDYIGENGRYQWRVFATLCVFNLFASHAIHIVFIGADMPHWCHVPELYDLPYDVQKNVAIPAESVNRDGYIEYSSCEMFSLNYSVYNRSQFYNWNRSLIITNDTSVVECSQWMYDQSQFISTIVKKFNLVCGWNFLVQFATTSLMGGVLVSSFMAGALADRFGRKKTMLIFSLLLSVGILLSIFGNNYTIFVIGRFFVGCGFMGIYLPGYVLLIELVGGSHRTCASAIYFSSVAVGISVQPAIAFLLPHEFWYQVAVLSLPFLFPLVIVCFVPESVRWLAVHGHYDAVVAQIRTICRINGRPLPEDFNPTCFVEQRAVIKRKNCSALLTSATMRFRTLVINFSWFTCGLVYYALALNTGSLHGNIFINTFIAAAVDIPAFMLCTFLMQWKPTGRRGTGCVGLSGAGISSFICIPMIIYNYHAATVTFAMLGKLFISLSFAVVYVHASELFPTEVRNVGVGSASMCARVSSMAAAYVGGPLAIFWKPLPSLVFGVLSAISGLLYTCLPETLGQVLSDTIEEVEQLQHQDDKQRHAPDDHVNDNEAPHSMTWNAFEEIVVKESDAVEQQTSPPDVVEDTCL